MEEPHARTGRGKLALLALASLLAPGLICVVSAALFKASADALLPVVIGGSIACGLAAGVLMTIVTTLKGGARIGVGFVLCSICVAVCAVLSFMGCAVAMTKS